MTSPYSRPYRFIGHFLNLSSQPDFLVIGTQRGGSTSLYKYLVTHPDIKRALHKEIQYFSLYFKKNWPWYLAHFPLRYINKGQFITGEASPYYLFHPDVPKRVAERLPNIKLIVTLRNPIDRAYSQYKHEVNSGFETRSFEAAVEDEGALRKNIDPSLGFSQIKDSFIHQHYLYVSRGIYVRQLKNWMEYVPLERILVLKSENLFTNPKKTFSQVLQFLELPSFTLQDTNPYHQSKYSSMNTETREQLRDFYTPFNKGLSELINISTQDWV